MFTLFMHMRTFWFAFWMQHEEFCFLDKNKLAHLGTYFAHHFVLFIFDTFTIQHTFTVILVSKLF